MPEDGEVLEAAGRELKQSWVVALLGAEMGWAKGRRATQPSGSPSFISEAEWVVLGVEDVDRASKRAPVGGAYFPGR